MLIPRVLSALVGIPVAVFLVCQGGWWLAVPVCLLSIVGFHEFITTAHRAGINAPRLPGYVFCGATVGCAAIYVAADSGSTGEVSASLVIALLGLVTLFTFACLGYAVRHFHRDPEAEVVRPVGTALLGGLYAGVPFCFFLLTRAAHAADPPAALAGLPVQPLAFGVRFLLLILCATWATDSAAYFVGRSCGKHPLTPASPKKTVEGAAGAVIAAILVGTGFGLWFRLPWDIGFAVGCIAGVLGQFGDLAKSVLKRDLGVKDFGALIPGHGGVLDRFDSLLINVPAAYLVMKLLTRT